MRYKNNRTGAVINSPCVISGKDWEPLEKQKPAIDFSKMKKAELIEYAKDNDIDVSSDDTKMEIINKLEG